MAIPPRSQTRAADEVVPLDLEIVASTPAARYLPALDRIEVILRPGPFELIRSSRFLCLLRAVPPQHPDDYVGFGIHEVRHIAAEMGLCPPDVVEVGGLIERIGDQYPGIAVATIESLFGAFLDEFSVEFDLMHSKPRQH